MAAIKPRVWSWDQPGAPEMIMNKPGSLIDILDQLIVGTGPAFDGQEKCQWTGRRHPTEMSGIYIGNTDYGFGTAALIFDGNASGEFAYHVGEGIDNTNAIINRCRSSGDRVTWGYKGNAATKTRWWIIADERQVFIYISGSTAEPSYPLDIVSNVTGSNLNVTGFGDFIRWDGVPAAFQFGAPMNGGNMSYRYALHLNSTSTSGWWTSRNSIGTATPTGIGISTGSSTSPSNVVCGSSQMEFTAPRGLALWTNAYVMYNRASTNDMLGYVRGLYLPLHKAIGSRDTAPATITHAVTNTGASSLFCIMESSGTDPRYWGIIGVEVTKSWDER